MGTIQKIFEADGLLTTVKYALPDVMAFLISERGVVQAEKDLLAIGKMTAERMLIIWKPRNSNPIKLLKEIKKGFFKKTKEPKGKILERFGGAPSKILIRDRDCPVCPEKGAGEEVEVSQIHYCTAISGFVEAVLNYLIQNKLAPYTQASCKTVASVGSGHKYCEMLIDLKYGG